MSEPVLTETCFYLCLRKRGNGIKIPYGYSLVNGKIVMDNEKAEVVRSIFAYYLDGSSLGKVVDILFTKRVPSPTGKPRWTRASVDKLLDNAKYIPMVGLTTYMDVQFEKDCRCNVNHDQAGHPRKAEQYQSPALEMK